ncbi:MAG: FHA domain-containing protein [Acidobacteria bacterium]|nr:FHA domain-containing protein [Acidobacteriota bacterium]
MIRCQTCSKENPDESRFCDECGTKLETSSSAISQTNGTPVVNLMPTDIGASGPKSAQVTSVGVPPLIEKAVEFPEHGEQVESRSNRGVHAQLIIERGDSANTEFQLSAEESYIGRWDADNGIFPDVDLDAHDPDAKVSRRHARITYRGNIHMIEDLGSTNGTFLNRGRRLLPGSPQVLTEADEIIVGKTFLRFHIVR